MSYPKKHKIILVVLLMLILYAPVNIGAQSETGQAETAQEEITQPETPPPQTAGPKAEQDVSEKKETIQSVSVEAAAAETPESGPESVEVKPELIEKTITAYKINLKQLLEEARKNIKKVDEEIQLLAILKRNQKKEVEIRRHVEQGNLKYQQGKLEEAKKEWIEALKIGDDPGIRVYSEEAERRAREEEEARAKEEAAQRKEMSEQKREKDFIEKMNQRNEENARKKEESLARKKILEEEAAQRAQLKEEQKAALAERKEKARLEAERKKEEENLLKAVSQKQNPAKETKLTPPQNRPEPELTSRDHQREQEERLRRLEAAETALGRENKDYSTDYLLK